MFSSIRRNNFPSERDPGAVRIVLRILKSLFYQKLVKTVSSHKRQSRPLHTYLNVSKLIEK